MVTVNILSRSVTSRLTEELYAEYERWNGQDLSGYDVAYLFLDGVYESVRRYTGGQTSLCGWGICSDGRKVLLGLQAVATESAECWEEFLFLEDLKSRGLSHPLLVVSDGAKGFKKSIAQCFPYADRRRCIAHRMRNLIERSFVEQKRRTKIIPSHVNEKGAMKLVYGTLIRAAQRWQRVTMDEADLILLRTLRQTMCKQKPVTIDEGRISFKPAA